MVSNVCGWCMSSAVHVKCVQSTCFAWAGEGPVWLVMFVGGACQVCAQHCLGLYGTCVVGDDCLWCMSIVRIAVICEGPGWLVMTVGGACQVCAQHAAWACEGPVWLVMIVGGACQVCT